MTLIITEVISVIDGSSTLLGRVDSRDETRSTNFVLKSDRQRQRERENLLILTIPSTPFSLSRKLRLKMSKLFGFYLVDTNEARNVIQTRSLRKGSKTGTVFPLPIETTRLITRTPQLLESGPNLHLTFHFYSLVFGGFVHNHVEMFEADHYYLSHK